jgi:hypothetical protein
MIRISAEGQTRSFSAGAFDCCSNYDTLCQVLFCEPCVSGEIWAAARGEDCNIFYSGWSPCPHHVMWTRANLRIARGMPMDYVDDCCTSTWCMPCVTCQAVNELKALQPHVIAQAAPAYHQPGRVEQVHLVVPPPVYGPPP